MLLILHKYRPPSCPTPPPADPPQDSAPMTLSSRTCSLPPHSFPLELGQCPSPSTLCSGPRFLPLVWLSSHSVAQYPPRPNPELSSEDRDCFSRILTSPGKWNDRAGGGRALTELAAGPAGRRGSESRAEQRGKLLSPYPFVLSSQPDENSLDFSSCMLRPGIKNAQELACGVCLLNVDSRSRVSHHLPPHHFQGRARPQQDPGHNPTWPSSPRGL